MDAVVHKNCCVCGLDVSRVRRTKDPRGNYYCRPCYDTLLEAHQRRQRAQAALETEAAAAAIQLKRALGSHAREADEPIDAGAVMAAAPIDEAPALAASPDFQITALPASSDVAEPVQRAFSIGRALSRAASALSALRAADEQIVPVVARRAKPRHIRRNALRLSDLVSKEAQAAVEAARVNPRLHEADVPVSPITNLPVSALVDDYANLVEPRETVYLDVVDEYAFPSVATS